MRSDLLQLDPAQLREPLLAFIRKRVREEADAEDLVQKVLERMVRSFHTLEDTERLSAWSYRIARNVVADYYRAPGREEPAPVDDWLDESELEQDPRENQMVGAWVRAFIEALPPKYREAVILSDVEGLTHAEVADRLGLSVSGAKSRVQRGREKLRALLARCCTVEFDAFGNVVDWKPREKPACDGC
ncbi:MAG: RNA polymerase sigma factor SigZ [Myxococcota bacterium]